VALLRGLEALLGFYIPALFILGHDVRELTWQGGVSGTVKGDVAHRVLQRSLAVQVHLLQDWECRAEYSRTLSVALLQWQPWMTTLPGCCFVEESCEALLSRMVGRCRANTNLVDFADILQLFVTLPVACAAPRGSTGCVRPPLVDLFRCRLQRILREPASQPFASLLNAREARWQASFPADFALPLAPTGNLGERSLQSVVRGALVSLSAPTPVGEPVRTFLADNVPLLDNDALAAGRRGAMERIRQWGAERRTRQRQAAAQRDAGAGAPSPDLGSTDALDGAGVRVFPTRQHLPVVAGAPPAAGQPVVVSDDGSVYEPPEEDTALSEGYHSFGDTDSFGSAGDLVDDAHAEWVASDTAILESEGRD
jgi:hypothetical protein